MSVSASAGQCGTNSLRFLGWPVVGQDLVTKTTKLGPCDHSKNPTFPEFLKQHAPQRLEFEGRGPFQLCRSQRIDWWMRVFDRRRPEVDTTRQSGAGAGSSRGG